MIVVDTSVTVPAMASWHADHPAAAQALAGGEARLIAHVALETFAVLTRLPQRRSVAPADALALISAHFQGSPVALPADRYHQVLGLLSEAGLKGGAVYDALVGATAAHFEARLLTLDRRALPVYRLVGAEAEILR